MFQPLIFKEAKRQSVYNSLGEDAVNTAWVIFLSFVRRYNGADYGHLPGLIQCHLRYELLHLMEKQGAAWEYEIRSEDMLREQAYDPISSALNTLFVKEALGHLSSHQYEILDLYYMQQQSQAAIAKKFNCTTRNIRYQHASALKQIKIQLTE